MQYIVLIVAGFAIIVWTIRPLYNFFAKSKYVLLAEKKMSLLDRIMAGLPAFLFYVILILFVLSPAVSSELLSSIESGGVILLQLIIIFGLTRYDKRQTKYEISKVGIQYRKKQIRWDEKYDIKYKKAWFFVLHKPRFVLEYKGTKIVIPLLSENISLFVDKLLHTNHTVGQLCYDIYRHNQMYYVENRALAKQINHMK